MSIDTKIRTVAAIAAVAGLSAYGHRVRGDRRAPWGPIAKPPVAGTISAPLWAFPTGLTGAAPRRTARIGSTFLARTMRQSTWRSGTTTWPSTRKRRTPSIGTQTTPWTRVAP